MMRTITLRLQLAVMALCGFMAAAEELRFLRHFSDNMVLQRDKPATVAGMADPGATVTITFAGQTKRAIAGNDGAWKVVLAPMPAAATGAPLTATSSAGDLQVALSGVVVGDVFLFARQTSIDISLGRDTAGREQAANHVDTPMLRALRIQTRPVAAPQADLAEAATAGWRQVSAETALPLSAAAYYLGRDLAADSAVPVGIIDLDLGTAFPISWLSRPVLEQTETFFGKSDVPGQLKRFDRLVESYTKGEGIPHKEIVYGDPAAYALFPAGGYNAVLHPLRGLALKAALVQLGNDYPYMIYAELEREGKRFDRDELNRAYVQTYDIRKNGFRMESVTTPRIPREWRKTLGDEALPVALVMPPGSDLNTMGQHHREMRELHRITAEENPNVGLILPGSENIPYSAQPEDEALLGDRCLHWVRGAVYGEPDTPATGPLFDRIDTHFNQATIHFKPGTAKGLRAEGGGLATFEAAAIDGDYVPVTASIEGETIRIESNTINRIMRVRYNWNQRPNQQLVNAAGLPAIPFRSERAEHHWFVRNEEVDLPIEYSTPANEWPRNDVTLVNGQLKTHGYGNFTGWLGPIGVKTGPFGPNMGVREVKPGSPADGKLFAGDVIYSVNGTMVGDRAWEVMGAAITDSETRGGGGKMVLGVRRDGENVDVELALEVMGSYSPTAPFDCPKTEKIVDRLEDWLVANGAGAGFLNTDAVFMLATGNPELSGYVRRIIYQGMAKRDPNAEIDPKNAGKSWFNSAEAFLLGEYYLATGDRNVLPYLKHACDRLAATQNPEEGGWRHNFPGGPTYGLIPNAGLPGVMGMHFAKEAGVDINLTSYQRGLAHFGDQRAETGYLIYGFGGCRREIPVPFDPRDLETGRLESYNGGLSAAGILMGLAGRHRAAHLCSFISAFAWNNTFGGHGGNFWNNFWTPLGAHAHSKPAFIHFWRNHRWYRECNRMFDGGLIRDESGRPGAGPGVALVAPRRRIQVVGAPPSPFATDAPAALKPALNAYWNRDYAGCETLVKALIESGTIGQNDLPTVEYLAQAAHDVQASVTIDLNRMRELAAAGDPDTAKTFLPGLKGILPADDARIAAIETVIAEARQLPKPEPDKDAADAQEGPKRDWRFLVTEIFTPRSGNRKKTDPGKVPPEQASVWRINVVEHLRQAPEGWVQPDFDDSDWPETHLPISWRMYHTALLRTTFNVADKDAFDGLRFRGWLFRQQGIEVYLNGQVIGKVNNLLQKTGNVDAEFKESATRLLRNGENTLAVTTRHNWRWGMLSMKVYNDGFGFRLEARVKE